MCERDRFGAAVQQHYNMVIAAGHGNDVTNQAFFYAPFCCTCWPAVVTVHVFGSICCRIYLHAWTICLLPGAAAGERGS
jgi:hypothetical protein